MKGRLLLLLLPLALAAGCKPTDPTSAAVRVRGRITVNGAPLRSATVVFVPDRSRGNTGELAIGVTTEDGAYELSATAGWHRVTIAPSPDDPLLAERLDKYRNPDSSDLQREVVPGPDVRIDIQLEVN